MKPSITRTSGALPFEAHRFTFKPTIAHNSIGNAASAGFSVATTRYLMVPASSEYLSDFELGYRPGAMTDLADVEINVICGGYVQNAAKVRYLRNMGLTVRTKPNGRPLVNRNHYDEVTGGARAVAVGEPNWSVA